MFLVQILWMEERYTSCEMIEILGLSYILQRSDFDI
jgi:hypothetical protein